MSEMVRTLALEWSRRKLPFMVNRDLDLSGYADARPAKVIAVSGFRRVGKTYSLLLLARRLLETLSREEVVYLNFEDERIPLKTEILTGLLPALAQVHVRPVRFLLLDEIQAVPEWSRWVRRVYDTEDVRLFISGSSSKMSAAEIPTELRGRFLLAKVFPLSFPEFLRFRDLAIDLKAVPHLADEKARLLRALGEYLHWGGLPEIVLADPDRRLEIAQSYYQTIVRRDIVERNRIRNDEAMTDLGKHVENAYFESGRSQKLQTACAGSTWSTCRSARSGRDLANPDEFARSPAVHGQWPSAPAQVPPAVSREPEAVSYFPAAAQGALW